MNRLAIILIASVLCIGFIVLIFSFQFLLNIPAPSQETQRLLSTLSPEQQQAYLAQQYEILRTRQAGELKTTQQAFLWSFVWRVIWIGSLIAVMTVSGVVIVRKSRYQATTTMTEPDGRSLTTRIPIIPETQQERIMLASAQVARNLALAQGDVNEQTQRMMQAIGHTVKDLSAALPRQSKMLSLSHDEPLALDSGGQSHVPPLATLLDDGTLAPGKPLIMGFSQGDPQYSLLNALKTLAVTGWQGSGKTVSIAYLVATAVLAYAGNILCIILDPHQRHEEGLSSYLAPLQQQGLIDIPNLFYWGKIWTDLNDRLDRRLRGEEPSSPHVLVVADEMGNLLRRDTNNLMVKFLDRATEETRKTEMTLVGCSHKWTARHFSGHADIRRCMNSLLIHRTKPSNAEMLLEDMDKSVKKQLKAISQPGEGLFVRDYGEPVHIRMPFTRKEDM